MVGKWLPIRRRLGLVFLAVMLMLAATLGWLGWRLLSQDQQLSAQRLAEQRETAADLAVAALERRLSAVEHDLDGPPPSARSRRDLPSADEALFFEFRFGSVRAWPDGGLLYRPDLTMEPDDFSGLFAAAEDAEFRKLDYAAAIAALRGSIDSRDPKVAAATLVRTARTYLKAGRFDESLQAYTRLSELGAVPVGGVPAALAAGAGRLAVFQRRNDPGSLQATARALSRDLDSGRWPVSFATYQYLSDEAARVLPKGERAAPPRLALAEGVAWLWERWTSSDEGRSAGRTSVAMSSGPVLLIWRTSNAGLVGFVAGRNYIANRWLPDMKPLLDPRSAELVMTTDEGRHVLGSVPGSARPAIRLASMTQLPWTVQVYSAGGEERDWSGRRRLLVASMGVVLALILTGGWFVGHAVARQLAVADLQSDFVSAVSHEFRTPLTTLCQLSELLMRDRVASDADRRQYYELLHNESHRLRRLVEALLDFGRLEAGRMPFRFEELDAAALLRQSAADFAQGQQCRGHRVQVDTPEEAHLVRADRETLRSVFWNLFENAVKYSPDCDTVWVELAKRGRRVEIAIRDRGTGIPAAEQRRIFEKFVRGSAARDSDVRGTGIGLAMARQIARAHGGDITVESEPGKGSTFRLVLPGLGA